MNKHHLVAGAVIAVVLPVLIFTVPPRVDHSQRNPFPADSPPVPSIYKPPASYLYAPEGSPQDFVASVLSVDPQAVTGLKLRARNVAQWEWDCQVEGQRVVVATVGGARWNLRLRPKAEAASGESVGGRVTEAEAQAAALSLARRRLGSQFSEMELTFSEVLPKGDFCFSWSTKETDERPTESVSVMIASEGGLRSYHEHLICHPAVQQTAQVAEQAEPAQDPGRLLAGVLGVKPEQLGAPEITGLDVMRYTFKGRTWTVSHRPWVWEVETDPGYRPKGALLSVAEARAVAERYVRRRWQGQLNVMGVQVYRSGGAPLYIFSWGERLEPGVMSGCSASVMTYGDGTLNSYKEHRVPAGLGEGKVKISEAQARATADKVIAWGARAEGRRYTYESQSVVLWDVCNRPMWSVRYASPNAAQDRRTAPPRFSCIRVDGTNGVATYQAAAEGE